MKTFEEFEQIFGFDQAVLEKIVQEGEIRLEAQLTTANSADQRALSFAGLLIGTTTATVGAAIALAIAEKPKIFLIAIAFTYASSLLIATFRAVHSFRPKPFSYPGNLPENWLPDQWNFSNSDSRDIKHALVEQCYTLNQATCKNQYDMDHNAKKLKLSINIASKATAAAALVLAFYSATLIWPDCTCLSTSAPPALVPLPSRR
jgi:hypothetical protein